MRFRGAAAPRAALVAAGLLAVAAAPAGAMISPVSHDNAGAASAVRLTADVPANFPTIGTASFYTGVDKALEVPPNGSPVATGDAASGLFPFPLDGTGFLVMSTGNAAAADDPDLTDVFPDFNDAGPVYTERGSAARDVSVLRIPFTSPVPAAGGPAVDACLTFDFRFLSEEYPAQLGSQFNDAFIAELDSDNATWATTGPGGATISAPNNFAVASGQQVTIKATGVAAISPAEAAGTPYGAATGLLRARVFVPASPTTAHDVLLSLFDHGGLASDSAVFIDNITLVPNSAEFCPRGVFRLGPSPAITGPTIAASVDTPTPTLTGTAGNARGDSETVMVRLYNGGVAAGAPVQTLAAARNGTATWSVATAPLAPGQYTAQATQANVSGINGVSAPTTFSFVQPGSPGQPGSGASQQQTPGDRDGDGIPDDQDTSDGSQPPIPGKTFDARVISGSVFIKYAPGTGPRAVAPPTGFVALKGAANIPIGSQLDTRKGHVSVTSAANSDGSKTQAAEFYDAIFQVKQTVPKTKPKKPVALITDLVLKGEPPRSECAPLKGGASVAAAKKKKKGPKAVLGSLWGSAKGKFRTNGKYSSATVRGTIWLTQDRCDGTLTTVKRGTVSVRDFRLRKTVSVKAGHSYLARAQRAASKAKRRTK